MRDRLGRWCKGVRGIFEFRLNRDLAAVLRAAGLPVPDELKGKQTSERILLRVFCHAYGNRVVLLLGGYDKAEDPSKKRQSREITLAERRLKTWQRQHQVKEKARRRTTKKIRSRRRRG